MAAPSSPPPPAGMLMNPGFQLRYTGMIVGVALALLIGLGVAIDRITGLAARSADDAAQQAEQALHESQVSARAMRMNDMLRAADNPTLMQSIEAELAAADARVEQNLAQVRAHRVEIRATRRKTLMALLATALLMSAGLAATGIVLTRRVLVPMLRIRRLLRKVTRGKLDIQERMPEGDEIGDLFNAFVQMVDALKQAQNGEIEKLSRCIVEAEKLGAPPQVLMKLGELRKEMLVALEPPDATSTTHRLEDFRAMRGG